MSSEGLFLEAQRSFQGGHIIKAQRQLEHLLAREPAHVNALNLLARILFEQGNTLQALQFMQEVVRLVPDSFDAWLHLGHCLFKVGNIAEASRAYRKAVAIRPTDQQVQLQLSSCLFELAHYREAQRYTKQVLKREPNHPRALYIHAHSALRNHDFHAAHTSIEKLLKHGKNAPQAYPLKALWLERAGCVEEAVSWIQKIPKEQGAIPLHILLYWPELTGEFLLEESKRFVGQWKKNTAEPITAPDHGDQSERLLRVGFLSPDFCKHVVAQFIEPLFVGVDPARFEYYFYSDVVHPDDITKGFEQRAADRWRDVSKISNDALCKLIREDKIDILVDLFGLWAPKRIPLYWQKPAPVQVSWLGYPVTTGMPTMDYRLTDAITDPPGESECSHTETLVRLEEGFHCYQPACELPDLQEIPCHTNGNITFGSFNNISKINSKILGIWQRILEQLPGSTLLLKDRRLADKMIRKSFLALLKKNGMDVSRITLRYNTPSMEQHLAAYNDMDIALDTFPYNGTTTICDALLMGVPVVTLQGELSHTRVAGSLLTQAGLHKFVAQDENEYVDIALQAARDIEALKELKMNLRNTFFASPLGDVDRFSRKLQNTFRDIWDDSQTQGPEK